MAEGNGDSGSGLGFFVGFFLVLIILALSGISSGSDKDTNATSTESVQAEEREVAIESRDLFFSAPRFEEEELEPLDSEEAEEQLADFYDEIDDLREDLRIARLWGERSPYQELVTLRNTQTRTSDFEREYLTLTASRNNERAVNISGWYLESVVTEERAALPDGTRVAKTGRVNPTAPIFLEPGERAFLLTSESPIGVSFLENDCTGYLAEFQDFRPTLTRNCPRVIDEMERYSGVDLDNDSCYDFVERIRRCEITDEDEVRDADLSGACRNFIIHELDYNACVERHRFDPFFDEGDWYVYLERDEELWRKEREIIRLIDENDRTIAVIEY